MDFLEKFNKQKLQKITLVVIAALTLLALVLLLIIIISSVENNPEPDNPNIPSVNNSDELKFETITIDPAQMSKGSLVLINTNHKYEIPSDLNLILISEYRDANSSNIPYGIWEKYHMKLEATATEYAHKMLHTMAQTTANDDIMITSSYRSYEDQTSTEIPAGYSDHHSGMLIAIRAYNGPLAETHTDWLDANAHKYGFVVRYPEDKTEITGISDYTHAYRYVGVAHATYMKANNLCLEEYVEYLKGNATSKKPLSVTTDDGSVYYIYYELISDSSTDIKVPVRTANPDGSMNYDYTISGTNDIGVVVTVKVK